MTDTKPCNNLIHTRRMNITKSLTTFLPKDIGNLVSEYDYYLEGTADTFKGHCGSIFCIAEIPNDHSSCSTRQADRVERIVTGSSDSTLRVWNLQTGKCDIIFKIDRYTWIECVAVLPCDPSGCFAERIVSGSHDGIIRIWNLQTEKCDITFTEHDKKISCLALLPDGRIVSGSDDFTLKIWNVQTGQRSNPEGKCDKTFRHNDCVQCLAVIILKHDLTSVFPDYRIISGSNDTTCKIWNPQTGECDMTFTKHNSWVNYLSVIMLKQYSTSVLSDGPSDRFAEQFVNSGSIDGTLKIWDPKTGNCNITFKHSQYVRCVAILSDSLLGPCFSRSCFAEKIVSGSDDYKVRIWNVQTGECDITLSGHSNVIFRIVVLPDGRIISGSNDNTLKIWDIRTGNRDMTLEGHTSLITSIVVLSDGRIASGSCDSKLKIWS
jgi:WD40 repeat protein